MIRKFKPRNCVIEAVRFDGNNIQECRDFVGGGAVVYRTAECKSDSLLFPTNVFRDSVAYTSLCQIGEWIAKETCKEKFVFYTLTQEEIITQFVDVT